MKLLSTIFVSAVVCFGVLWVRDQLFLYRLRSAFAANVRSDWIESQSRVRWFQDHRLRTDLPYPDPQDVREAYWRERPAYLQAAAAEYDRR
jgi:hypothetical protein